MVEEASWFGPDLQSLVEDELIYLKNNNIKVENICAIILGPWPGQSDHI